MRTPAIGFAATVLGLGALALSSACADQPKPYCQSGRGEFAARYKVVSGPAECAQRKAELFGIQSYNLKKDGEKPGEVIPDVEKTPVAIQPVTVRGQADNGGSDGRPEYATGIFTTPQPDDNDLCRVDMKTPVEIKLDHIDEAPASVDPDEGTCTFLEPEQAERTVKYEFKDVAFYVTAAAAGTQFKATVTITDSSFAGGAACTYEAVGMYPAVSCGKPKLDYVSDCKADLDLATSADPTLRVTDANAVQCTKDAKVDQVHGLPVGTSVNPDFAIECANVNDLKVGDSVPTQHLCLPTEAAAANWPSASVKVEK